MFAQDFAEAKHKVVSPGSRSRASGPRLALPGQFRQQDVKNFVPPGSNCWRGNTRGEWWCHVKPFKRRIMVRIADHANDERRAILSMMQKSWMLYNQKEGLPLRQCPIDGLFQGELAIE